MDRQGEITSKANHANGRRHGMREWDWPRGKGFTQQEIGKAHIAVSQTEETPARRQGSNLNQRQLRLQETETLSRTFFPPPPLADLADILLGDNTVIQDTIEYLTSTARFKFVYR